MEWIAVGYSPGRGRPFPSLLSGFFSLLSSRLQTSQETEAAWLAPPAGIADAPRRWLAAAVVAMVA